VVTGNIADRLEVLVQEAVNAGAYRSKSEFFRRNGLSTGTIGELRKRLRSDPGASMNGETLTKIAGALGVTVQAILLHQADPESELVDKYRERAVAIDAARSLKFPEAAIQLVLTEDPGGSPSALYWFRRIEAESERVSPAARSNRP
jgi:transcriptional regulator with XRE-family HTH domain